MPRADDRHNQFGIVRLVLACLVILSHSPPLTLPLALNFEPFEWLTGTTSFGDLAVDFFFVISGYLVSQSMARSRSIGSYLEKRVRRIYPGFIVATIASLLLAFATGGRLVGTWTHLLFTALTLGQPIDVTAFSGNSYQIANGSLWTIRLEFMCYLLPSAAILTGVLDRPRILLAGALLLLAMSVLVGPPHSGSYSFLHNSSRLSGTFLAGMFFRVAAKDRLDGRAALGLFLVACASLFTRYTAGFGIAFAGGHALLWLCLVPGHSRLAAIGRRTDVSYGVYLYGWPAQSLVIWLLPGIGWRYVFAISAPVAIALGWISWTMIEAPLLRWRTGNRIAA